MTRGWRRGIEEESMIAEVEVRVRGETYAGEFDAAVTAFGGGAAFLDVKVS